MIDVAITVVFTVQLWYRTSNTTKGFNPETDKVIRSLLEFSLGKVYPHWLNCIFSRALLNLVSFRNCIHHNFSLHCWRVRQIPESPPLTHCWIHPPHTSGFSWHSNLSRVTSHLLQQSPYSLGKQFNCWWDSFRGFMSDRSDFFFGRLCKLSLSPFYLAFPIHSSGDLVN